MKLIAKKPCNFCGQQFFVGDCIPGSYVVDAEMQEMLGVITITTSTGKKTNDLFTKEQVDIMIADAVASVERVQVDKEESSLESVLIPIKGESEEQCTSISVTMDDIQQVFSLMQMSTEDEVKAIATITSDNTLILLHAVSNLKTIKDAARKRADKLFSTEKDGGS